MENKNFQTVLITGASSGIGAAIARAFAKKRAALSLTGRNEENLSKVAQECKDLGAIDVVEIIVDFCQEEGIEKAVKKTMDVYDKLDVLVNNAGLGFHANTKTTTFEVFNTTFNVNLKAPFFLTQMCIPHLEKSKGNIINISSLTSKLQTPSYITYCMTKAALDNFTKNAALELSAKGIRVNSVRPAAVASNVLRHSNVGSEAMYRQAPLHPLGKRLVEADEIADAVLFLSSDAARMITGTCLAVDGGRILTGS